MPSALIVGGDYYIAGDGVTSTENAQAEANKIGISTSISSFVGETEIAESPHVAADQPLYCLDDRPLRRMQERAESQDPLIEGVLDAPKADGIDTNSRETELTCRTGDLPSEAPESYVAALVTECRGPISIFRP